MSKLDQLWVYQEADMEVVRFENEMRRDPTRTKLLRLRNFVVDQQTVLSQLEEAASASRGRVAQLEEEKAKSEAAIEDGVQKLDAQAYQSLEDVQAALRDAQRVMDGLKNCERELKKIVSDAKNIEDKLRDVRQKVAQARTQYTTLKAGYDDAFARQSAELDKLKAKRDKACEGIEAELLKRYEAAKQQCTPPMAKLNGDRCGGCNMSLPAAIQKRVRDASQVIECENCGRILLAAE